jgi:hypothetical protein
MLAVHIITTIMMMNSEAKCKQMKTQYKEKPKYKPRTFKGKAQ